jgi:hypothetical protein
MFDNIHVRDIKAPQGVKIIEDEGEIVVSVLPPSKVEEPVAAAVPEAPLEPELIGEKKPAAEEPEAEE